MITCYTVHGNATDYTVRKGFPGGASDQEPACQFRRHKRSRFEPCVRKFHCRGAWQTHSSILPWKIQWTEEIGRLQSKKSQSDFWLKWLGMHTGEGNGNPPQCCCLENPVDGRAWWAAIHGEAQSRTWLKQLSMHACIGEGNSNPLQYSCLENPRDRGAWWAAIYGVAQSWMWLKQLSSSSSSMHACIELENPVLV